MKTILDSADVSIISTDPQGVIETFNTAAQRMLGYRADEVVGKTTPAILHDPEEVLSRAAELTLELGRVIEPGFEVFVAKARAGDPEAREWTYIRKDGSEVPIEIGLSPIVTGEGNFVLATIVDISERKRMEEGPDVESRTPAAVWTCDKRPAPCRANHA